jgi:DnaJ-class molecular chaperone
MTAQKPRPVAVCTRCGAVSDSATLINGCCGNRVGNQQCTGVIGSATNANDWDECPSCAGSGTTDAKRCGRCDGSGWLFVRDRRR